MKTMSIRKRLLASISVFAVLMSASAGLLAIADNEEPVNLLRTGHLSEIKSVAQDKDSGAVTDSTKFDKVLDILHDGNTTEKIDVTGLNPVADNTNYGVQITLDKAYTLTELLLYTGVGSSADYLKVYASEKLVDLYKSESLISGEEDIEAKGETHLKTSVKAKYIAVLVTKTVLYDSSRPYEYMVMGLESTGTDEGDQAVNLLPDHLESAIGILQEVSNGSVTAPDTTQSGSSRFDQKGALSKICDGDTSTRTDVYNANWEPNPKYVGVQLTLDDVYDVGNIKLYSGLPDYKDTMRVYASENLEDLYTDANKIADDVECTGDAVTVVAAKKVKYVAIILKQLSDGRVREFEVYTADGTEVRPSTPPGGSDVDEPDTPPGDAAEGNLLAGMTPDLAGVTTGDDFETLGGTGGNLGFEGLTDNIIINPATGKNQDAQFWNGKSEGTKFVFTYDLGMNYDLNKIAVFAVADYLDSEVHQGIETWNFYASRYREDLFKDENKINGKTGYNDPADISKEVSLKQIRFVSFVFTIQDTLYGACRLTELQVFGTESSEQDADKPVEELPEYTEIKTENGIIVRVYARDGSDDVSLLNLKAVVEQVKDAISLKKISGMLDNRYIAEALYTVTLFDENGDEANVEDRVIRMLLPVNGENRLVVAVDEFSAELLSAMEVDDHLMVEVVNNGAYAVVVASGMQDGTDDPGNVSDGVDPDYESPGTGVQGVPVYIVLAILAASAVLVFTRKNKLA